MLFQGQVAGGLVLGGDQRLVGGQADLGVHHHLLVPRQLDQHVGLEALALGALQADLGLVLAALLQAGVFQDPLQHQLAPVALGLLPFQGTGEVGGFVAQALVELLQALQLLAQGEAFAGFLLIAFLHPLLEGLDALLERIEQLAEALLAGFGETLLAFVEDLPGQLGELRAQVVTGCLQVAQALFVGVALLPQLGFQAGTLGGQAAQLGLLALALLVPGLQRLAGALALDAEQLGLTAQGRQFGLLGGIEVAELAVLLAAVIQLHGQAVLGQLGVGQAFFEQGLFGLQGGKTPVLLPGQAEQGYGGGEKADQQVGDI
ncbi:hypothetical protein D9M70_303400 [compost metagenome]